MAAERVNKSTTSRPRKKRLAATERAAAQDTFIATFRQTGNVSAACRAANIERSTIYKWLEHDTPFTVRYHEAEHDAQDVLRGEAFRRAVLGWDEPVVSMGKVVIDPETGRPLMLRKRSDVVLLAMLKARVPEYMERRDGGVPAQGIRITIETDALPAPAALAGMAGMVTDAVNALPAPAPTSAPIDALYTITAEDDFIDARDHRRDE